MAMTMNVLREVLIVDLEAEEVSGGRNGRERSGDG